MRGSWVGAGAVGLLVACTAGDGDNGSFGDGGSNGATATSMTGAVDGGTTGADGGSAGPTSMGNTGAPTTAPTSDGSDTGDTGETTGSTTDAGSTSGGGESSSSSSGGIVSGNDYEPCNVDNTCDDPSEVCLQVGIGGFCTNTCGNDLQCPPTPAGSVIPATCDFLLGFPDFTNNYCGMTGCNFIFNDCPGGMTCTYVVMGLNVCEWT